MANAKIRLLVADSSAVIGEHLRQILEASGEIEVVGAAQQGTEILQLVDGLRPDLIAIDPRMPADQGFLAIEQVMAHRPTPILVLVPPGPHNEAVGARALTLGALDVIEKPVWGTPVSVQQQSELLTRVRRLAGMRVIRHLEGRRRVSQPSPAPATTALAKRVAGVVSSTGGPAALVHLLRAIPADFDGAVLVVQHIAPGFLPGLVDWLAAESALQPRIAQDGEPIEPGVVLLAPDDFHLTVAGRRVRLTQDPRELSLRPSGNVLLRSLAAEYGAAGIGVILTGMGADGADGARSLRQAGGRVLVQDEATSAIFGMPRETIAAGAADEILALPAIGPRLVALTRAARR